MEFSRRELLPNVFLTHVRTDKFKSAALSAVMLTQLDRENASSNALLPSVLRRGTASLPDMTAVQNALDSLYGASAEPSVRRKGEIHCVGFRSTFCDERFLPEKEDLSGQLASLVSDLLLHPRTKGGLLLPAYVESERDKLVEKIDAVVNDKLSYAVNRLLEEMCCYEDYGAGTMGNHDSAESIYYVQLSKHYRELLSSSPLELFYCGAAEEERIADALSAAFLPMPRGELNEDIGTDIRMNTVSSSPRFFEETMDVAQCQLALGFRLGSCMEDPDPAVLRVLNGLYGGSVTGKLFMNVREKLSLAYYASSTADFHKGVMIAYAGINGAEREKAQDEMLHQLDEIRKGAFTAGELESVKAYIASRLRSTMDSPAALEDFYLDQTVEGLEYGPEELSALVESVTADQVVAAAEGVALDAVYFLRGEEQA